MQHFPKNDQTTKKYRGKLNDAFSKTVGVCLSIQCKMAFPEKTSAKNIYYKNGYKDD